PSDLSFVAGQEQVDPLARHQHGPQKRAGFGAPAQVPGERVRIVDSGEVVGGDVGDHGRILRNARRRPGNRARSPDAYTMRRQTLPQVAWQPIPPSARPSCSPATGTCTAAPPVRRQRRRRSSPARAWRRPGGCTDAMAESFDVLVIGAGAAGLMCAITAGRRDRRVLVVEHANKPGKKILMSGGGRCNFTNTGTAPENFLSANPHYCKSALARYTPADFIAMVERHGIGYHEK